MQQIVVILLFYHAIKMEYGEDPENCLVREVGEELGCDIVIDSLFDTSSYVYPDGLHYVVGNSTLTGDPWLRKNLKAFDDDNDGSFDEDPYDDANADGIISGYDVFLKHPAQQSEFLYSYYEGIDDDGKDSLHECGVCKKTSWRLSGEEVTE